MILPGSRLERREDGPGLGPRCTALVTAASCGDSGRVAARCAPEALRRSGRAHATGFRGHFAPSLPGRATRSIINTLMCSCVCTWPAPPGARRAPRALETVGKVLTGRI